MVNKYRKRFSDYILMVLSKLPPDVQKWVSCNVTLHEPPEDNCVGFAFKSETIWHVVFPSALFRMPVGERLKTMAHEIAHCYLGHECKKREGKTLVDYHEDEAELLIKKWGF